MQWISELKDIGVGKKCLIIGGGHSVIGFDFDKLDWVKIGCNESGHKANEIFGIKVDYSIYYDLGAVQVINRLPKPAGMKLICANEEQDRKADYQYRLKELQCKQSDNIGKKALIIAHDIFKFSEIYLIGFDFSTVIKDGKEVSHFFGDDIGRDKKYCEQMKLDDHFKRLNDMISQFDTQYDNVWNLNKSSKLKIYDYKEI